MLDSFGIMFLVRSMIYDLGTSMIAMHFSRTELELLVKAIEVARQLGMAPG
jgi:hypothetical protein